MNNYKINNSKNVTRYRLSWNKLIWNVVGRPSCCGKLHISEALIQSSRQAFTAKPFKILVGYCSFGVSACLWIAFLINYDTYKVPTLMDSLDYEIKLIFYDVLLTLIFLAKCVCMNWVLVFILFNVIQIKHFNYQTSARGSTGTTSSAEKG